MNILDYTLIYLIIGTICSGIFDLMHYLTKGVVDEKTYQENGFSNTERITVILTWPTILFALLFRSFGSKVEEPSKEKESSDDKSEETMD